MKMLISLIIVHVLPLGTFTETGSQGGGGGGETLKWNNYNRV